MPFKVTAIFILCFLSLTSFGQKQSYINSLQSKLIHANDSQKIGIYNGLSWAHKYSNPHLAYEYGEKAFKLSTKQHNRMGQAISFN